MGDVAFPSKARLPVAFERENDARNSYSYNEIVWVLNDPLCKRLRG